MILPILVLQILPTTVVLAFYLGFPNVRSFYHDIRTRTQQFILQASTLDDLETLSTQNLLLADTTFMISHLYKQGCSLMGEGRVEKVLSLMVGHEDLWERWLGAACLSDTIVEMRKSYKMWPPVGVALLVDDLQLSVLSTKYVKEILQSALTRPISWCSSHWIDDVKWGEMDDLSFWRMIPALFYPMGDGAITIYSYLSKALCQNVQNPSHGNLEELLIKSIRMTNFHGGWNKFLKEGILDQGALFGNFSSFNDPWSTKVIKVLKVLYSDGWERLLSEALLRSELLRLDLWQGLFNDSSVDLAMAINDILELLTVAFRFGVKKDQKDQIVQLFGSLVDGLKDDSGVRPVVLRTASQIILGKHNHSHIERYFDRMLKKVNISSPLPIWSIVHSTSLQEQGYRVRRWIEPLLDEFEKKRRDPQGTYLDLYTSLLYEEWKKDKTNWPGLLATHERMKGNIRRVFKPSQSDNGAYDPKTDQDYDTNTWHLAFSSIKFDVEHGIPSSSVPSKSFLSALLLYHNDKSIKWCKSMFKEDCIFLEDRLERDRYEAALRAALNEFFLNIPALPSSDPHLLQALIRKDCEEGEE